MRTILAVVCAVAALAAPSSADSVDFVFDFEGLGTGTLYGPTDSVSITVTDFGDGIDPGIGDVTLIIERPGSFFTFTDLSALSESEGVAGGVRDTWGASSLDPFVDVANSQAFIFTAIVPAGYAVLNTHIEVGDFAPSDADKIGYDGEIFYLQNNEGGPDANVLFKTLDLFGIARGWDGTGPPPEPIDSWRALGGGPEEPMSLFWDNVVVSVVEVDDLPTGSVAPPLPGVTNSLYSPGYIPDTALPSQPVPEPGSLALIGAGVAMLAIWRRRQR